MTARLQDKTWANIPKEAKELVRKLYRTSHIPQYEVVLGLVFGSHNLGSCDGGHEASHDHDTKCSCNVGDMVVVMCADEPFVAEITDIDKGVAKIKVGDESCKISIDKLNPGGMLLVEDDEADDIVPCSPANPYLDEGGYREAMRVELAKAVAVAYAEKGRYEPSEIGAKAVEVANGVFDRLKERNK